MTSIAVISPRKYQRQESVLIGAVIALTVSLATAFGVAESVNSGAPVLLDWQLSSFADLGADDQAIHSALSAAGEEIGSMNYDFGDWVKPEELDNLLVSPFYKDEFWTLHGSVSWELIRAADLKNGGDTAYLGTGGAVAGQSAYLLLFRHRHLGANYTNQVDIWMHRDVNARLPGDTKAESLVTAGWKQVITYNGADELTRLKGM